VRIPSLESLQACEAQHFLDPSGSFASSEVMEPEGDVVLNAQVGKQRILLKDHPDAPILRRDHDIRRRHELAR